MDFASVDLDRAVLAESFSGVAVVDVGAQRVLERVEGFAHRAHEITNTVDTRFATASGSKGFTALAIMRLVEDGVIDLHTTARSILGDDLPLIDDRVTIEHLLTHTSGIGDYLDEDSDWESTDYVLPVPIHLLADTEAFVPVIDGFAQKFAPGERFSYCNGGYIVLAIIVQRASRQSFHDFVEAEVCARAGLQKTSFLRSDELPGDAAHGYLFDEGNRTNVLHLPVRGNGDGGIYTTADDMHRFWQALFAGRIVSTETVAEMTQPRFDLPEGSKRYGMGFWVHRSTPAVILEGYDAGVSFRSTHDAATVTTATVFGTTSEGAWPLVSALNDVFE